MRHRGTAGGTSWRADRRHSHRLGHGYIRDLWMGHGSTPRLTLVSDAVRMPDAGQRVLSMGVDANVGAAGQDAMRRGGLRATVITVTDDDAGDEVLRAALRDDAYDAVGFGAGLSGQAPPEFGATSTSTLWCNRLLNIVHSGAPTAKIFLPRGPQDVVLAVERVLGRI